MKRLVLSIIFLWIASPLAAQYYIAGQEPSSVKWFEQKTHFGKLIFPSVADSLATVFNRYMVFAWDSVPVSLNHNPKTFPAIIHPNSVLSNGFFSWGPKRMEIVSQATFDASPEPWLLRLALHEIRHVVQVDKLNKGVFRLGSYLLGEQAIGLAVVQVPLWFLEGDAIYTETALSGGGRGRQASFFQHYRSHLLGNLGNKFRYDKWLMGSYKDYIPNHYRFGYLMVGYGSLAYGQEMWSKSLEWVTRHPYSVFPFYFSIKKKTGLSRKQYFEEALYYLDSIWKNDEYFVDITSCNQLIKNNKTYSEYRYPFHVSDSSFVALKSSLGRSDRFILIDVRTGEEKKLHQPGIIIERVSFANGSLYWSEYKAHPRWGYLNYAEVWRYDIAAKRAQRVTSRSRLFNPVVFSDGTILAIEHRANGKSNIVTLSQSGEPLVSLNVEITLEPKELTIGKGSEFFLRASTPNGSIILKYDDISASPDTILGPLFRDISNITYYNNQILFTITHGGVETLFSLSIPSGEVSLVAGAEFGLTNPSIFADKLVASAWNTKGLYPVLHEMNSVRRKFQVEPSAAGLFNEGGINSGYQSESVKQNSSASLPATKKHSTIKNLLNFHSWAPFYYNPFELMSGTFDVHPGVTAISQNLTSTLAAHLGYSYNETHGAHAHVHWMGWYPIISAGIDIGNIRPAILGGPLEEILPSPRSDKNVITSIQVQAPLRLTSGSYHTSLTSGLRYYYNNIWLWDIKSEVYKEGFDLFTVYSSFYRLSRMAYRDLRPRLGFFVYSGFSLSPIQSHQIGESIYSQGRVYLPGLLANHSVMLTGQGEKKWTKIYILTNRSLFPRGNTPKKASDLVSGSIDYSLPLLYPDFPLGPIAYLKRLSANLFFDNVLFKGYAVDAEGEPYVYEDYLGSTGVDIYSDMHFFRTRYEIKLGYRFGLLLPSNGIFHEFLVSINPGSFFGHQPRVNLLNYSF